MVSSSLPPQPTGDAAAERERLAVENMLLLCGELGGMRSGETLSGYLRRLIDGLIIARAENDARPTGDVEGLSEAQLRASIVAFWKTWPAFAEWWMSRDDGYGGKQHIDSLPPEPFEAAIEVATAALNSRTPRSVEIPHDLRGYLDPEYASDTSPVHLARLLRERDDFIASKGLWSEFVAALSTVAGEEKQ